jgi:hypothetical protein
MRDGLLQELELLADDLRAGCEGCTRDVCEWPTQAGDEAQTDRIDCEDHDDGNAVCRILCCQCSRLGRRDDQALADAGLAGFGDRDPATLSGG